MTPDEAALISVDRVFSEALVAEACDIWVCHPNTLIDVGSTGPQEQAIRGELHKHAMIETV